MEQEIIDGKIVTKCSKCGKELKSLIHTCTPFIEEIKYNDNHFVK